MYKKKFFLQELLLLTKPYYFVSYKYKPKTDKLTKQGGQNNLSVTCNICLFYSPEFVWLVTYKQYMSVTDISNYGNLNCVIFLVSVANPWVVNVYILCWEFWWTPCSWLTVHCSIASAVQQFGETNQRYFISDTIISRVLLIQNMLKLD